MLQVTTQVSHSAMQKLQLSRNFSDSDMRLVAAFMRRSTGVNRIIEPNYEPYLVQLHRIFSGLFTVTTYTSPDADNISVPLAYCYDTSSLINRLQSLQGRSARVVHHGVDAGTVQDFLCVLQ